MSEQKDDSYDFLNMLDLLKIINISSQELYSFCLMCLKDICHEDDLYCFYDENGDEKISNIDYNIAYHVSGAVAWAIAYKRVHKGEFEVCKRDAIAALKGEEINNFYAITTSNNPFFMEVKRKHVRYLKEIAHE